MILLMGLAATWWFWLLLAEVCILFWLISEDSGAWAFMSLAVFGALLWATDGGGAFEWASANTTTLLWWSAAYIPLGTLWATAKWVLLVYDRLDKYKDAVASYTGFTGIETDHHYKVPSDRVTRTKARHLEIKLGSTWVLEYPPNIANHKADFIRWLSYWPVSLLSTLCYDFIKRLGRMIYNRLSGGLQRISDKIFAKVDLPKPDDDDDGIAAFNSRER